MIQTISHTLAQVFTPRFLTFCVVGGLGFGLDVGLTVVLSNAGLGPFLGRILAIAATIFFCWRLNRWLTFDPSAGSQFHEGLRYFGVAASVGVLNYLLYAGLLIAWPQLWTFTAITIATAACTLVSYLAFARYAFRPV